VSLAGPLVPVLVAAHLEGAEATPATAEAAHLEGAEATQATAEAAHLEGAEATPATAEAATSATAEAATPATAEAALPAVLVAARLEGAEAPNAVRGVVRQEGRNPTRFRLVTLTGMPSAFWFSFDKGEPPGRV